jgi:hypothetical protein
MYHPELPQRVIFPELFQKFRYPVAHGPILGDFGELGKLVELGCHPDG